MQIDEGEVSSTHLHISLVLAISWSAWSSQIWGWMTSTHLFISGFPPIKMGNPKWKYITRPHIVSCEWVGLASHHLLRDYQHHQGDGATYSCVWNGRGKSKPLECCLLQVCSRSIFTLLQVEFSFRIPAVVQTDSGIILAFAEVIGKLYPSICRH